MLGNDAGVIGRTLRRSVVSPGRRIICPLIPKYERLISCLEPDDSATYVCAGDKEFFDPGEVL